MDLSYVRRLIKQSLKLEQLFLLLICAPVILLGVALYLLFPIPSSAIGFSPNVENRSPAEIFYTDQLTRTSDAVLTETVNFQFDQPIITLDDDCDDPTQNWDFEARNLQCWERDKSNLAPWPTVVPPFGDDGKSRFDTYSGRLGASDSSDASPLGTNGYVVVHRSLEVPPIENPELRFEYLMYSHDIIASSTYTYDTFAVAIDNLSSIKWYTGNPTYDWGNAGTTCRPDAWVSNSGLPATVSISLAPYVGQEIDVFFVLRNQTDDRCNSWVYVDNVQLWPEMVMEKTNDPSGPVHEGDVITYTINYANTSLITQVLTITDQLPFNLTLVPGSTTPQADPEEPHLVVWSLGEVPPGGSGQVSFRARVALLPSLHQEGVSAACPPDNPPDYVVPAEVNCETTHFWAHGVTVQPPVTDLYTFQVQIPSGSSPTAMWLLMKGTDNSPPVVEGQPAHLLVTSNNVFGASVWTVAITSTMIEDGEVTVRTNNSRELNAFFLFNADDPPFDPATLDDLENTTKTFTYTLDIPSVATQTIDVLLPFMDITSLRDDAPLPDTRITEVSVEFDGHEQSLRANRPNLGNGLLMTTFRFAISPFTDTYTTKALTVTVNTEDSIYTLGPRVCRPVYIENTAWLCSLQAGCISDTVVNIPEDFMPYGASGGIYLPLILKAHP